MTLQLPWEPSLPMRKFRAKAHREHPETDFGSLTPLQVQTLTNNRSVVRWAEDPATGAQFWEWFCNRDYNRQQLEATADLAIRRLYDVLANPEARAGDLIAAAREILKFADYTPSTKKEVIVSDKILQDKSEDELREFIREHGGDMLKVVKE